MNSLFPLSHRAGRTLLPAALTLAVATSAPAQSGDSGFFGKPTLSGSIQSDILFPQSDSKIGTGSYSETALTNTFAELSLTTNHLDAGARLEYLEHPLPGFHKDYAGWGVPFFYLKGHVKHAELTLGTFYEQFGSGFVLRTYEERSLGIDNSLLGGRLVATPVAGATVKVLAGKQRRYWNWNDSWVGGADLELGVDQWVKALRQRATYLTLGASYVTKY